MNVGPTKEKILKLTGVGGFLSPASARFFGGSGGGGADGFLAFALAAFAAFSPSNFDRSG